MPREDKKIYPISRIPEKFYRHTTASLIKVLIKETEKYLPHPEEYLSHPITVHILLRRINYDNWALFRSYIMQPLEEGEKFFINIVIKCFDKIVFRLFEDVEKSDLKESTNGWIRIQSTYPFNSERRPLKWQTI